jgi:E3 ubiquitin-protein ligase HECTD2
MPPRQSRQQSYTSNGTTFNTSSGHIDTNRPLPQLPPTAVDLDVPALYPPRGAEPQVTSTKHGRSFSHPFPSFFGAGSKRSEKRNLLRNRINIDSTDDDESIGDGHSNRCSDVPSRSPSANAGSEPRTGRCMTCDSTVRWPRDLRVFRCTICLTVNDLEPNLETNKQPPGTNQGKAPALFAVPRKRMCSF